MTPDATALKEPLFWTAFLCSSFGQIGEPFDPEVVCSAFGVTEDDAQTWWHKFTGWYDGILDESDGWLENPAGVIVPLAPSLMLEVETHPGGTVHYLASDATGRHMLGDCGPHWRLPMLRWSEAALLSPEALLLTLPGVWVAADQTQCRDHVERAFQNLPLRAKSAASKLADQWVAAVGDGGTEYSWSKDPELGWVSSAHWSVRSINEHQDPGEVRWINEALAASGLR
jgi:hypothetical protein